ncbi:MAG: hypothetical protein J1E62_02895 [Lachnospiraceae bacterium]|nr:hypothetical protein [Lachnospiraceae bacterium]
MIYLLITVLCYTICTISDKYSISKYRITPSEFTFLISASSCIFMVPAFFFTRNYFELSLNSFLTIALLSIDKIVEFSTSAAVLKKLSGFETKAWLGTAMFLSYFSDITFFHVDFSLLKLLCIFIVCGCLVAMVKDGKNEGKNRYKGIGLILILYILSKYFYGIIIKIGSDSISPTISVYAALLVVTVIFWFKVKPAELLKEKRGGTGIVFLTRIPNALGLVCENLLIGISLTMYSMEQPVILALLLFYSFIRRENTSKLSMVSGIICLIAVFAFKLV